MTDINGNWIPHEEDGSRDQAIAILSLRDYFAAQALQRYNSEDHVEWDIHAIASDCYRMADAMIAARKK